MPTDSAWEVVAQDAGSMSAEGHDVLKELAEGKF
jgi:hypothetical protein